jgi:hypothetical protein
MSNQISDQIEAGEHLMNQIYLELEEMTEVELQAIIDDPSDYCHMNGYGNKETIKEFAQNVIASI